MQPEILLLFGLLMIGCICTTKLSSRFNMPCLLVFLAIGMLFHQLVSVPRFAADGTDGGLVGGMSFFSQALEESFWPTANFVGALALAFILFAGGYGTSWQSVRKVWVRGGLLSSVGVLLTACGLAACAHLVLNRGFGFGVGFLVCLLLGAIISSTDAAAVFSILRSRSVGLKGGLRDVLEVESGSNDPMATFLTIFLLDRLSAGQSLSWASPLVVLGQFVVKMGIGIVIGLLCASLVAWLFNTLELAYDSMYHVLGLGAVIATFGMAETCWGNGFMAVYAAGIYLGNHRFTYHNSFGRFSDAVSWLMQVILFGMLGLLARPRLLWEYKWAGAALALCLMFLVRPLACLICLAGRRFRWREWLLVSWVGLRGGAPIVLATFPFMKLGPNVSSANAEVLFSIIFIMVLLSVVLQGMTIMPVARWLKLDTPLKEIPQPPLVLEDISGRTAGKESAAVDAGLDFHGTQTQEFLVGEGSDQEGKTLAQIGLPPQAFVIMIRRGGAYMVPKGNSVLRAHDCLTILGRSGVLQECEQKFKAGAMAREIG